MDTKENDIVLTFEADSIENTTKDKDGDVRVTIKKEKQMDFLVRIMEDEMIDAFLSDEDTKKWFIDRIGVEPLLKVYTREDVLKLLSWEYVREFFFDHMDIKDVLNHIGWENIREHFADKLLVEKSHQNDINNSGNKSVLEELNASEGEN